MRAPYLITPKDTPPSGFLTPTSGNAYIYGMDTKKQMEEIRRITGLCPQHNILYPLLTVDEHLTFMRKVKKLRKCWLCLVGWEGWV